MRMMAPERLVITDGMRFHTVIFRAGDCELLMPGRDFARVSDHRATKMNHPTIGDAANLLI